MTCVICGNALTGKQQRYCGTKCSRRAYTLARMADGRSVQQNRQRRLAGKGMYTIACEMCGKTTMVQRNTSRFCDLSCYNLSQIAMAEAQYRSHAQLVHVGPVPRKTWEPAATTSGRTWIAGHCAWCDRSFVIVDQMNARYCSTACGKRAGRARRGRFDLPPRERFAIYERDSWTCQLCFGLVDPSLHYLDPWAATLDHIECQSWGERPDHSPSNLRLAHRWCNAVRSDETYWTAADLVA